MLSKSILEECKYVVKQMKRYITDKTENSSGGYDKTDEYDEKTLLLDLRLVKLF